MKKTPFTIALLFLLAGYSAAQDYQYRCGTSNLNHTYSSYSRQGPLFKPFKTLPLNDMNACFRIMVVFVEFKNDFSFVANSPYWTPGEPPVYFDSIVAPQKDLSGYPDHIISDYFNCAVRDSFDVTGKTYYFTLPHTYEYYKNTFGDNDSGRNEANRDVLRMLDTNLDVNWLEYDQWHFDGEAFVKQPDGYIDMIYIQYRRGKPDFFSLTSGGHADLMVNYNTLRQNKFIREGTQYLSSGLYGINGASESKTTVLDYFVHEYTHYLLGDHQPYSRIHGGDGYYTDAGFERIYTPQDQVSLSTANLIEADWTDRTYFLKDFVTTGQVVKVPAFLAGDYFLICNRRRFSKYDRNMGGDTVMGEFFGNAGNYDKGIYIYHVFDGNDRTCLVDMECADGLWNWENDIPYSTTPDWSELQLLPTFTKTGVGRNDDEPGVEYASHLRVLSRDGMSVISQNWDHLGFHKKWFSPGKRHTFIGDAGMERTFTNKEEQWCSRECIGDRYDAWRIGYNVLFSPYSSPNTKSRLYHVGGDQTGIFIYITNETDSVAEIKVLRSGYGGFSESQILALTPPARPMLYGVKVVNCNGSYGHPMITWDNNIEPDMLRAGNLKKYHIFRAESENEEAVPDSFVYIGDYDDRTPDDTANFIDNSPVNGVKVFCNGTASPKDTYYRYVITAADKQNKESVRSDFVSIKNHIGAPFGLGNSSGIIPEVFSLEQNYPNPFNPLTLITYGLPFESHVTLKVYNALGQEVKVLLRNEFKPAGKYEVLFDGVDFASGIYFYAIEAGDFRYIRKMVLLK